MKRRAFTLLEVLIALVLIAAVASSLFAFLGSLTSRAQRVGSAMDRATGLEVLYERLEAGLAGSYAVGATGEAGVVGEGARVAVRGRGVLFAGGGKGGIGDSIGSEFAFDEAAGRLTGRSLGAQPGSVETLAEGIERMRIRYHDGTAWRDSFDSSGAGRLPAAIEVSVWFGERPAGDAGAEEAPTAPTGPVRSPDRRRVITVPDAPGTTWKEGA